MDYVKYILVLVVLFVENDAGGHDESHHDHVKLHVPEFVHHDHHTKVITIHHHHHIPKKEQHHHHHHHHKPIIPYGPPKYHHTHHQSKSSSHSISKGHTSIGKKIHGKHGHFGKHGHSGHHSKPAHDGHNSYQHHDVPSYEPPSTNYDTPTVNYAPPAINYSPSPSYGGDYSPFIPSVPHIPSPQVHGVVHTVQQVKVFDSLPGGINTGSTGYQVTEEGEEGQDDIFTSVNSLSQSYPGSFGHVRNAADQGDPFLDIAHSNSNQSPNSEPFSHAQPQPTYADVEDFTRQQSAQRVANEQPINEPYSDFTRYDDGDSSVLGSEINSAPLLSFSEAEQDNTPVSFSREAGLQRAVNTGGIETVVY